MGRTQDTPATGTQPERPQGVKAMQVADALTLHHGKNVEITNLTLNNLVYFTQVEALRMTGSQMFSDRVEAWDCGPVEPEVYATYHKYGYERVINREGGRRLLSLWQALLRQLPDPVREL